MDFGLFLLSRDAATSVGLSTALEGKRLHSDTHRPSPRDRHPGRRVRLSLRVMDGRSGEALPTRDPAHCEIRPFHNRVAIQSRASTSHEHMSALYEYVMEGQAWGVSEAPSPRDRIPRPHGAPLHAVSKHAPPLNGKSTISAQSHAWRERSREGGGAGGSGKPPASRAVLPPSGAPRPGAAPTRARGAQTQAWGARGAPRRRDPHEEDAAARGTRSSPCRGRGAWACGY